MTEPRVSVHAIGHEGEPVVVIDGFSPHPDRLRAEAADAAFTRMGDYYPGVRAPVGPAWFEGVGPLLAAVARRVFGGAERLAFDRALYSITTTAPHDLALAQRIPHVDSVEPDRIAIIHYLGAPEHGGTAFFRHRATGFETVTAERQRPYLDALAEEFRRDGEPPPAYIQGDTDQFERIAAFDALYNRALIYRGRSLHCAIIPPDFTPTADLASARLTVAGFGRVE